MGEHLSGAELAQAVQQLGRRLQVDAHDVPLLRPRAVGVERAAGLVRVLRGGVVGDAMLFVRSGKRVLALLDFRGELVGDDDDALQIDIGERASLTGLARVPLRRRMCRS